MENPIKVASLGVPLFLETPIYINIYLGGGNSKIFWNSLPRKFMEDEPILRVAYFSKGLVKNQQLENVLGCVFLF